MRKFFGWCGRHKILTSIIALFLLGVIGGSIGFNGIPIAAGSLAGMIVFITLVTLPFRHNTRA